MNTSDAYLLPGITPTPESIIEAVALVFEVTTVEIYQKRRHRNICEARMISMYLIHKMLNLSLSATGFIFLKDHCTVINACKKVIIYSELDKDFRVKMIRILHNLGLPGAKINEYLKGN